MYFRCRLYFFLFFFPFLMLSLFIYSLFFLLLSFFFGCSTCQRGEGEGGVAANVGSCTVLGPVGCTRLAGHPGHPKSSFRSGTSGRERESVISICFCFCLYFYFLFLPLPPPIESLLVLSF
ncbi:hypothetical protein CDEST_03144 [Colletotrichum destructivum]|uniref:Secreted protein n=1 Tax=Colletotrichum destructivum TaxID=34406 RepID=A0AAX4I463_9PEZI|nr:hypothetical protein CDEST_03144 [Colletotrichum destructivum]